MVDKKEKVSKPEKSSEKLIAKSIAKADKKVEVAKADSGKVDKKADGLLKSSPARLQVLYQKELAAKLQKQLNLTSIMEVPRLTKITLNMGVGDAVSDKKLIENAVADMTKIAGQKPQIRNARIAIANFKVRQGFPVGCKVTLRGKKMWEFLDRLISVAIPRIRDFRGISGKQFDGRGNFSMGVTEQIIFPEIEYDKVDKIRGMNIVLTTTAKKDEHAKALLAGFSFPFRA